MFAPDDIFILLHSIMQKMRKIADRELAAMALTHAEMRVLMALYHLGGRCSQEQLAAMLGVDRSNAGRSLKKLENLNYVQRNRRKRDGRAFRVSLTENGWAIRKRMLAIRQNIKQTFTMQADADELVTLTGLLKKADRRLTEENFQTVKNADRGPVKLKK